MNMTEGSYKAPKGLIRVRARIESGDIKEIQISGDFFMYPEATIIDLEEAITGTCVEDLESTIIDFFESRTTQLIGVGPNDFIHVIRLSLASAP